MKTIGNIIWFFFGGIELALLWFVVGVVCCITIVGIPAGIQCFKFAGLACFPFGKQIDTNFGAGKLILNIIWIILFGWELAVSSCAVGIVWCCTIVGIPFGMQCFKLAQLALMPFGANVTKTDK